MQKSILKYEQGDIVVLELPFTDMLGSKLRPVLVINKMDVGKDLIVLKITGKSSSFRVKLRQPDLKEGRIKKESYIDCSSIFTVDKSLIVKKVGSISEDKLKEVMANLKMILGVC